MADIYDIVVANMKIGAAIPVLNDSFKYWDDAGTWAAPSAWTKNGTPTVARIFTGYDDDAAVQITKASAPDNDTVNLASTPARFWPDNRPGLSGVSVYYSWPAFIAVLGGPGANGSFRLVLETDDAEDMVGALAATIRTFNTVDSTYTRRTGVVASAITSAHRFARTKIVVRDATSITARCDNLGIMFNPFDVAAGYYQFTSFAHTGPSHRFARGTEDARTQSGENKRFDASGGNQRLRLTCDFVDENLTFYKNMKLWYDWNHGTPGIPGMPLLLEVNLPGYPATMLCNITEQEFPIDRVGETGSFYGGTMTFESIY